MLRDLVLGPRYLGQGFRAILTPGLRRYAAAPMLISALSFSLLGLLAVYGFEALLDALLPASWEWLRWLLWPIFALAGLLILAYGFALLANLVAAPFTGPLSAAVERARRAAGPAGEERGWGAAAARALTSELRRLVYYLVRAVPLLLCFLVPVLNLAAPFLWILFTAWMLGLEYLAHPLENRGTGFAEQRSRARARPLLVISFGATALGASLVPVLNFFVLPAAVAGATLLWLAELATPAELGSG